MTKQFSKLTAPAARRLPVGRNYALLRPHRRPGLNADVSMIYARSSTQFSGCYVQVASGRPRGGAIWLTNGLTGKPYTAMAPATRFDQWKTDGTFERINLALN